jgi:DNA mismatch repair protein MutL
MGKISVLAPHEAQKIAAGEVVERPANVIKELIENSLDAQSTSISIWVNQGAKSLLRVSDNGSGMDEDDAVACFNHHATSKITTVNELETLSTLGFRGEALSSIASVAQVTLTTRTEQCLHGHQIVCHSGTIISRQPAAATVGTDISIADLFYNVPARRKFLKTAQTEWRQIVHMIHAYCMAYPHVHFKLYDQSGDLFLNCPPGTLQERISFIWGHQEASSALPVDYEDRSITIKGVVCSAHTLKYDRSHIYMFVNKRWIKNHALAKAIMQGYSNTLLPGRYPVACILIEIDSGEVDINVHPRKEEVQFAHPYKIQTHITNAVHNALEKSFMTKGVYAEKPVTSYTTTLASSFSVPSWQPIHPLNNAMSSPGIIQAHPVTTITSMPDTSSINSNTYSTVRESTPVSFQQSLIHSPVPQVLPESKIVGQLLTMYIIVESSQGLLIIDQHAAHERILYEKFRSKFGNAESAHLLFAKALTLHPHDIELLEPHFQLLASCGVIVERMGSDTIMITGMPLHAQSYDGHELIKDMLVWIASYKPLDTMTLSDHLSFHIHSHMSCKAAVKAGDILSHDQMKKIVHDLQTTSHNYSCPHGRPTSWTITEQELLRKFRRT